MKQDLILFVGDVDISVSNAACYFDPKSVLIDSSVISNLPHIQVGYISIGDNTVEDFVYALTLAKEIYYIEPGVWSSPDTKLLTEIWLRYFSHQKTVHNFLKSSDTNSSSLVDQRKTDSKQLWNAGCSFTFGCGIDLDKRYGDVISKEMRLPISFLAAPGSSISWASDQIIRSDIRKDDIVIWGITGVGRIPFYNDKEPIHINTSNFSDYQNLIGTIVGKNVLVSDHILQTEINAIDRVINFSKKIGFNLVLTQFPLSYQTHEHRMLDYLSNFSFFISCYTNSNRKFLDYGDDDMHPGPLQHQQYADIILEYLKDENIS